MMEFSPGKVNSIIKRYGGEKRELISILQDIQSEYNYLSQDVLLYVAQRLELPLNQVFGVATFYSAFNLSPRGRHLINVCLGTACHGRGSTRLLEGIERALGIKAGGTSKDDRFSLETVNCVGACASGPVLVVDGEYFAQMRSDRVNAVLKKSK